MLFIKVLLFMLDLKQSRVAEVRCRDNSEQGALVRQPLLIAEPWEHGLVSGVAL